MKKIELENKIKKILILKRIINKNIKTSEFYNLNIFDNSKIDFVALMTIISEIEIATNKEIKIEFFKIKKNQTIKKILDKLSK